MNIDRNDLGWLVLRVGVGGMFLTHGIPKLLGGQAKWEAVGSAVDSLGIHQGHVAFGLCAALAETLGGLLVAIGFYTRPAAAAIVLTMAVAANLHLRKTGLADASHAIEDGFAMLAVAIAGAGRYSVDRR